MRPRPWIIVALVGSLVGALFAGVSTYDFVQHLDRQVHAIHCSFIPGGGAELSGSGCQAAMMSPYSSVLRTHIWGGVPIALPGLAVFAFLALFAIDLMLTRREADRRATGFLAIASIVPVLASIVMGYLSATEVHALCKQCLAIYIASGVTFASSVVAWRLARRTTVTAPPDGSLARAATSPPASPRFLGIAAAVGVLFVVLPFVVYAGSVPDHAKYIGTCGGLASTDDNYKIMVPMRGGGASEVPAIEIVDPLCPSCRAFEQRLEASGMADRLHRQGVLFPLDNTCNWMVDEAIHPGACAISEAVLCAGDRATDVLDWAFANQDAIKDAAAKDPNAAAAMAIKAFPDLEQCIGSSAVRSKLNSSLRWAVANRVQVLTPQLFVGGVKLCDEDVDLGLDYQLNEMIDRFRAGALVATTTAAPAPTHALTPTDDEQRAMATSKSKPHAKPAAPAPDQPVTEPGPTPKPRTASAAGTGTASGTGSASASTTTGGTP